MYYSKLTGGFYNTTIHGDNIPADSVEITNEEHAALLEAQSQGKRIESDLNGYPVAVDPPPPSIDSVKLIKVAKINAACTAAIVAGFASAALGTPYTYTATLEDQSNLTSLVLIGADDYYTCIDASSVKAPHLHTIAQLKTVLVDGGTAKKAHLIKAATLKAQIAAAADAAAVEAVVW